VSIQTGDDVVVVLGATDETFPNAGGDARRRDDGVTGVGHEASPSSSRRSALTVLRVGGFRRFLIARSTSVLGSAMAPVALAFAILDVEGASAAQLGWVFAARSLAQVALVVVGGVVADRFSRYRVMVLSDLVAGASQGALGALFLTGHFSLAAAIALAAVNGAASAAFMPASAGLVPELVMGEQLQPANAVLRLATNGAGIGGAAVAGVIVSVTDPGWAVVADAATYLLSAAWLIGLRMPLKVRADASTMIEQLREGWREFVLRPWVWIIVLQFSISNGAFTACLTVLVPLLAESNYGGATGVSTMRVAQAGRSRTTRRRSQRRRVDRAAPHLAKDSPATGVSPRSIDGPRVISSCPAIAWDGRPPSTQLSTSPQGLRPPGFWRARPDRRAHRSGRSMVRRAR
jgi:MFS family permease